MSFRVRVLMLVGLVAVIATAATAWLTLRQATAQLTESAAADQVQLDAVRTTLAAYAREHGTWEGVPDTVLTLYNRFGQRLHLTTDSGIVIADTDQLQGRTARALGNTTVFVDPRPTLRLPDDAPTTDDARSSTDPSPADPVRAKEEALRRAKEEALRAEEKASLAKDATRHAELVVKEIMGYRQGVLLTACLSRDGGRATISDGPYGVPRASVADPGSGFSDCQGRADADAARLDVRELTTAANRCETDPKRAKSCLRQLFTDRVSDVAPVPLRVYLGARGTPTLAVRPVLAAAALVAILVIAGTTLISRRVLRPIGTLTAASRRLGEGDLTGRVPVAGHDELAELARSFNRMADSLQRGEESQRRMVADVAHELRTPLANLRGYLEALKDGVISPGPEVFSSLHEEAVLQQRIVDDLQDLAMAEAGSLAYHRVPVDMTELLETCRTAHHAVAEAAGVHLVVESETPVWVHADPDRLRQVLGNLVSNALRATPSGGVIRLCASEASGTVFIRVIDTGTGIPAQSLPYVFDRFWRADSARNRRTGGSGLGLAIARQIVTDHGGGIAVSSAAGQGTTFTITLPGTIPPTPTPTPHPSA